MKCFNHPHTDSVAQCSRCQKGLCTICTYNVDRATFCTSCYASGLREEIAHAQRRINGVWIFVSACTVLTAITAIGSIPQSGAGGLLYVPLVFVVSWCLFWGWPPVWNGVRNAFAGWGCFGPWYMVLAVVAVVIAGFLFPIAMVIGAFVGIKKHYEARQTILNGNQMLAELYATPPTQRLPGSQGGSIL